MQKGFVWIPYFVGLSSWCNMGLPFWRVILEGAEQHEARDLRIGTQDIPDRLNCLQAIALDRFVVTTDRRMWDPG